MIAKISGAEAWGICSVLMDNGAWHQMAECEHSGSRFLGTISEESDSLLAMQQVVLCCVPSWVRLESIANAGISYGTQEMDS